jgi:hypothetical protein
MGSRRRHLGRQFPAPATLRSVLTQDDYGALALLGSVEVIAKILFRWGLDGSFMRLFYDCDDDRARQRLAAPSSGFC